MSFLIFYILLIHQNVQQIIETFLMYIMVSQVKRLWSYKGRKNGYLAQIQPKLQFMFPKYIPPQDFSIMTLLLDTKCKIASTHFGTQCLVHPTGWYLKVLFPSFLITVNLIIFSFKLMFFKKCSCFFVFFFVTVSLVGEKYDGIRGNKKHKFRIKSVRKQ